MSYPDYPDNRLIVNGVDLSERFGMILEDDYILTPPSPKTYTVDIPGGNGKLDLTESLLGDTAYENREQEFTFRIIDAYNFERIKTDVSNFLHGKAFSYVLTMDPIYTYHGRFSVSEYSHDAYAIGIVGAIKIKIVGDPFKKMPTQTLKIGAIGGKTAYLPSGRMRVRPTIESDGLVKVIFDNKQTNLTKGTWRMNDILFVNGTNEIYFNSFDIRNLKWGDLKTNSVTWGDFKKRRLYEWYKSNGDGTYVMKTWGDLAEQTWADLSEQTWADQTYMAEITSNVKDVYIKYDWGDL